MVSVDQMIELMEFLGLTQRPDTEDIQRVLHNIRTAAQRHGLV